MHEMALVSSIADIVAEYASKNGARHVLEITLVIGSVHDVVDELMDSCFAHMVRGTVAEGAKLNLVKTPMRAQCNDCLLVYPADLRRSDTLKCPDCGSRSFSIHNGNEFLIRDIKLI